MNSPSTTRLDRTLASIPIAYKGPGGAAAVLRDGQVLARHAWGYANMERRIPATTDTLFRLCSITKQFTCALVLDAFPDPTVLDPEIRHHVPLLGSHTPGALHLCHNQSGLRDYWAVAMLHGAPAESAFAAPEAARLIGQTRTLQFPPGTSYSYVNQNFRILSDILEHRTGRSFATLLRTRLFDPAGMPTAILAADTRAMPDGTEGYEGTQATGFRPAPNRIVWTGDAGLGASLDDMIGWERWIDASRNDPASLYARLASPIRFSNGAPAPYGFGLARRALGAHTVIGHGGALRGWRCHRLYVPEARISVVIMFNHMADAQAAAMDLLAATLDNAPPRRTAVPAAPEWPGAYLDPESGLAARIDLHGRHLRLRYSQGSELLEPQADGSVGTDTTRLTRTADGVQMHRPQENRTVRLHRLADLPRQAGHAPHGLAGRYHCPDLDAELTIADAGGTLHGGFSGFLGIGRMEVLDPIGPDVWALPCPRALDHTPPGDWTLRFHRSPSGAIDRVQLGCWLARDLDYRRIG